ncbi:IncF plasmid conjugative transfer protein TrbC (plasmid) [Paramixta manurensis]|uniref:IncF plasmid conjugative transfer protein TrbC n=1 Tax=Paramixta manurensis TaxID=2740817 RepID=A0A6M8ULG0_9GAMM|nr:IncF plasmid conjugative transfer protein TrbC [Erwiniaceae bacterium PD-1]
MKNNHIRTLITSVLMTYAGLTFASAMPVVSDHDVQWMKEQQRDLETFKKQISGMNFALPDSQQAKVDKIQNDIAAAQATENSATRPVQRAVYFVSLGIPQEGLLPMLQDARRFGIPATIRGLLDNDFRKTASAVFELSKQDKEAGVQIDPTLFVQYGIRAVPALVVTCPGKYDVLYGSLTIKEALENIARRGECALTAKQLLQESGGGR